MVAHACNSKTQRIVGLNPAWATEKDYVSKQQGFWTKLTHKALHLGKLGYIKLRSKHR